MDTLIQFILFAVTLGFIAILGVCLWEFACTLAYIFWPGAPLKMKICALEVQRAAFTACMNKGEDLSTGKAIFRRLGLWAALLFVGYFFLLTAVFYLALSVIVIAEVTFFLALKDYKVEWLD